MVEFRLPGKKEKEVVEPESKDEPEPVKDVIETEDAQPSPKATFKRQETVKK